MLPLASESEDAPRTEAIRQVQAAAAASRGLAYDFFRFLQRPPRLGFVPRSCTNLTGGPFGRLLPVYC